MKFSGGVKHGEYPEGEVPRISVEATVINVKVGTEWKQLPDNDSTVDYAAGLPVNGVCDLREPCWSGTGGELRTALGVAESDDLWLEYDDGSEPEMIIPDKYGPACIERYSIFDDSRFFTAAREINNG
jgi:hypothetical protein